MYERWKVALNLKEFQTQGLHTERLRLRPLTLEDAPDLFEYTSYAPNTEFLAWHAHKSVQEDVAFIQNALLQYEKGEELLFGIDLDGKVIGTLRVYHVDFKEQEAEVSCILHQDY